jgi:hypothetical protein
MERFDPTRRLGLVVALLASGASATGAPNFTRLTACDEIARLHASLERDPRSLARECTSPTGFLERALWERLGRPPQDQVCMLPQPPARFLEGFDCLVLVKGNSGSLSCFRLAPEMDLDDYQRRFDTDYAARESAYLRAASRCAATNGDAAVAPRTSGDQLLGWISRMEMGYIAKLGQGRTTNSAVSQTYAQLDAAIGRTGLIETVTVFVNKDPLSGRGEKRVAGPWTTWLEGDGTGVEVMRSALRQQGIPFFGRELSISIERADGDWSQARKQDQLEHWQDRLADTLRDAGFDDVDEDDVAGSGLSLETFRERMVASLSPGAQAASRLSPSRKLILLQHRRASSPCPARRGAMMAMIMGMDPPPGAGSEFGSVAVVVVGIGACGIASSPSARFIQDAIDESRDDFYSLLGDHR